MSVVRRGSPPALPPAHALQAQRAHALQARRALPPQSIAPAWFVSPAPARSSGRQAGRKAPSKASPTFEAVIDSGCTWHSHPRREDLIHVRPCDDRIATADGADHTASCIGGLPVWAYDSDGGVRMIVTVTSDACPASAFTDYP